MNSICVSKVNAVLPLLFILTVAGYSQSLWFKGVVMDQSTGAPLPYANIGVKNKAIGGISMANGEFEIDLSKALSADTVVISYIGYLPYATTVSRLTSFKRLVIELKPTSRVLKEIIIRSKPEIIILGNKGKSSNYSGWGDFTSSRGRAIGMVIQTPANTLKLNKVIFHLHENEFDSVLVRINFYTLHKGSPKILEAQTKNLIATVREKKGWVDIIVEEDLIIKGDPLVIGIEWIDAWIKPNPNRVDSYQFTISSEKATGLSYIRQTPEEPFRFVETKLTPSLYIECVPIQK